MPEDSVKILVRRIAEIPRGRVTTYEYLAKSVANELSGSDVATLLAVLCRDTARRLLAQETVYSDTIPCWRIIPDALQGHFAPLSEGCSPEEYESMYDLVVKPLVDEGIPIRPPLYRIPDEYIFHW